jgi:hypothetical protein
VRTAGVLRHWVTVGSLCIGNHLKNVVVANVRGSMYPMSCDRVIRCTVVDLRTAYQEDLTSGTELLVVYEVNPSA